MSETNQPYSPHIYDQRRIDLARMILEKESRKLYLGLSSEAWSAMDASIAGWAENPLDYHLEDDGPRDFWDIFAALMESIKLKPAFTMWITAENVTWQKKEISLRTIDMTTPLDQLKNIPGLQVRNGMPFSEVIDVLINDPAVLARQKRLVEEHSTDPAQDRYPVILRKVENGRYVVMDGNRRTLKALCYGQGHIDAWVGDMEGASPENFWIPVNDMLQLLKVYKEATDSENEVLQDAVVEVLRSRFASSEVAQQVYENRIRNQLEIGKRLYEKARHN